MVWLNYGCIGDGLGYHLDHLEDLPPICGTIYYPDSELPDFMLGDGTEAIPYAVCIPEHIELIGQMGVDAGGSSKEYKLDEHYWLERSVSMGKQIFVPIGNQDNCFSGSFNGLGHTISSYELVLQEEIDS